jgi:hypothetical protein
MARLSRLVPLCAALALAACGGDGGDAAVEATPNSPDRLDTEVVSNETRESVAPPNEAIGPIADTTGAAEIVVAGNTVPRRGVVTDIRAGYQACYLTVRADNGSTTEIYGDFSLCETDGLVGQRVQLEYAPDEIPAPSCEGDPTCLETETVALAVVAEPLGPAR